MQSLTRCLPAVSLYAEKRRSLLAMYSPDFSLPSVNHKGTLPVISPWQHPQRHSFHPRGSSKEAACLYSQPKLLCPHQCLPFFPLHAELAMPPYPASAYIPWAFAYRQRKETLSHSYRAFSHDQNSWVLHCFHNHKRSASTEHSLSFFSDWSDSNQLSVVMVSTISCPLASPPLTN